MMNWQQIGENDFIARAGCYALRAEQMDTDFWWWSVYCKDDEIGSSMFSEPATTKKQALKMAEKCYNEHLNKTK